MRARISSEVVRLYAHFYGRGPTRAQTHVAEDHVLTVLEDVLTPAERTLVAAGRGDHVRQTRRIFQETLREPFIAVVEEATGRRVRAFLSQTTTEPEVAVELFLLEPEGAGADAEAAGP